MGMKGECSFVQQMMGSVIIYIFMNVFCLVIVVLQSVLVCFISYIVYVMDFELKDEKVVVNLMELVARFKVKVYFVYVDREVDVVKIEVYKMVDQYLFFFFDFIVVVYFNFVEGINVFIVEWDMDVLLLFVFNCCLLECFFYCSFMKQMVFYIKVFLLVFRG